METNGMKKSIFLKISAITFLMAGVVFCGCSNSNDEPIEPIEPVGPKTYTLTIEASKGGSAETRILTPGDNSLVSTWEKDDQVFVKHGSTWCDGSLKPQSEGQTTTLRGMITFNGEVKVNDDLTFQYPRETIDYTEQDGTLESIAAKYDYSVATATVDEVGDNAITVTDFSGFANQQAIVKFTLKDKAGADISATSLTISAEGLKTSDTATGDIIVTPTSATNALYVALSGIENKTVTLIAKTATDIYIYEKTGVTFSDEKYYEITVKMDNMRSIPLTFEAVNSGTKITFHNLSGGTVESRLNDGEWFTYTTAITLDEGDKVSFRGGNSSYYPGNGEADATFTFTGDCYVYGNVMSLVSSTGYTSATELVEEKAFSKMFNGNTYLKSHPLKELLLPATTLYYNCYESMFQGCTALTRAPELPATSLAMNCYKSMFQDCTGLTKAPVLPAATLVSGCYNYMFKGCTNLNYIKCLAKSIPEGCTCTTEWVNGVAESGTFVSADGVLWSAGVNGNPWGE